MNTSPNTEERIWAVFSHLSALALGMGLLLPIIGWSEQRRKSKYASFQCLQALGYQSMGYTVWLLAYLFVILIALLLIVIKHFQAQKLGQEFDPLAGPFVSSMVIMALCFLVLYLILPVVAA